MRTVRRPVTPIWVRLVVAAVVVGAPAWWLAERHDRLGNEARLSEIASEIAGREVRVRWPGPPGGSA